MVTEQPAKQRLWTDDELLSLPEAKLWQLVDGELTKTSSAGAEHGEICSRLMVTIGAFVRKHRLGKVYDGSAGFRLDGLTCFSPDIAFVRKQRLAEVLPDPVKFVQGAPDFAIEVRSPRNTAREMDRKIRLLIEHGCELVWFVLPRQRTVRVYSGALEYIELNEDGVLDGAAVLPGLSVQVRDVFIDPVFED